MRIFLASILNFVQFPVLRIRNFYFGSCFGSGSGLFRIQIRPLVSFGFGSGFGSGFESGFESWIRIRIQILNLNPD
jgi:hypothetical protein